MQFSKSAFLSSDTGSRLKGTMSNHLDIIDGAEVIADTKEFGHIDYKLDGEQWTLYPVMPEWCGG